MKNIVAEAIIAGLIENGMSRGQAVMAVVTKDGQDIHFGRPRIVEGAPLSEVYKAEMQAAESLSVEQASAVFGYLFDITPERAYADIEERLATCGLQPVTMH